MILSTWLSLAYRRSFTAMGQPLVKVIWDILNDPFLIKWQFSLTFHIVWKGREWLSRTVHYRQYAHPFPSTWASHIHFHISAFNHSFPIQESVRSVTKIEAVDKSWNKRVLVKPFLCSSMFSLEHISVGFSWEINTFLLTEKHQTLWPELQSF